jgi:multidrug resistance protein
MEPGATKEAFLMLRPGTFAFTVLLAALSAVGPLTTDMYLPSLPDIAQRLGAPTAQVQLTISSYLIGFAVGQIVYGPVSDRHGRKPVLVAALGLYCAASLACALSTSVDMLIAARALQALGGSGGIVLARAIVRDLYSGARAGRELSLIGSVMALAPAVAPIAGGVLQTGFGWRSVFFALAAAGVMGVGAIWLLLPETLARRAAEPVSLPWWRPIAPISPISVSSRRAMPACLPGFPARLLCCKIFTASRRSDSASPSRSVRSGSRSARRLPRGWSSKSGWAARSALALALALPAGWRWRRRWRSA